MVPRIATENTDDFRFERRLDFSLLQLLPVHVAIEQMILDLSFLAWHLTAAKSSVWSFRQQLRTAKNAINRMTMIDWLGFNGSFSKKNSLYRASDKYVAVKKLKLIGESW